MNLMTTDGLRANAQANAKAAPADVLAYAVADSDMGKVLIARSAKGVCSILIGETAGELVADLAGRFPASTLIEDTGAVQADMAKILRYIEKPAAGLELTLDMRGTAFQRSVWEKLLTIPAGETTTYTDLANELMPHSHPRAVASACAANSIALAVPCHRVVRSDGDLAGYRWGIERKRALIRKEAMA